MKVLFVIVGIVSLSRPLAAQNSVIRSCRELLAVYRESNVYQVKDCVEERFYIYWRIENPLDWVSARTACKDVPDADLASVHSYESRRSVEGMAWDTLNITFWPNIGAFIGLRRIEDACTSEFAWSDGSEYDYASWHSGEPNCQLGTEFCGQVVHWSWTVPSGSLSGINPSAVGWNDINCAYRLKSICHLPLFSPEMQILLRQAQLG